MGSLPPGTFGLVTRRSSLCKRNYSALKIINSDYKGKIQIMMSVIADFFFKSIAQ